MQYKFEGVHCICDMAVIKKLPVSWQGLFQCSMKSYCNVLNRMNEWYQDQTSSKYGRPLDWHELIQSLVAEEPMCTNNSLIFVTRFSHLPTIVQQYLLAFLLQNRHSIPKSLLQSFTDVIGKNIVKDTWVWILYRMIVAFLKGDASKTTVFDGPYEFTSKNKMNVDKLKEKIKKTHTNCSPWSISTHCTDDTLLSVKDEKINDNGSSFDEPIVTSPNIIMVDDNDEPPAKVPRIESHAQMDQTQLAVTTETSENVPQIDIKTEDLDKMKSLKEKWETGENTEVADEINVLLSSSETVVKRLCAEVGLSNMSEVALSIACNHLIRHGTMMAHGTCTVLLSALLLYKFKQMNQSPSRMMTGVVTSIAKSFSKPLIDGVFVPAIADSALSTFQADLVVKICKDVFTNVSRIYFIEQIFKCGAQVTDSVITVLQSVLESKLDMVNSLLLAILQSLKDQGSKLEKNLKYGKLVLALITKYGVQMTMEHKEMLTQILMSHKSFLKKSIQTAVSKL